MLDDLRQALRHFAGVFNSDTSRRAGQNIVKRYLPTILLALFGMVYFRIIPIPDVPLVFAYGSVPFLFDSSLFIESIPLLSRLLPRISIIIEIAGESLVLVGGISVGMIYTFYKLVGAGRMSAAYYRYLKRK